MMGPIVINFAVFTEFNKIVVSKWGKENSFDPTRI